MLDSRLHEKINRIARLHTVNTKALMHNNVLGPLSIVTLFVLCIVFAHIAFAADEDRLPKELAWAQSDIDKNDFLNRTKTECINPKAELDTLRGIKLGRLAFQSPRLLGGQASRMGLNCASCHPASRSNSDFFIKQISSAPGNADVSHGFLSSKGSNGEFNPVLIPDLANRASMKIKDRRSDEFRSRLTQLIEIEFDGRPPPAAVFEAMRYYLENTDTKYCAKPNASKVIDLDFDWQDLLDGVAVAQEAIAVNDQDTLKFAIDASRARLEVIYRRYGAEPVAALDALLIEFSRSLEKVTQLEKPTAQAEQLAMLIVDSEKLYAMLEANQDLSWYNPIIVHQQLNASE